MVSHLSVTSSKGGYLRLSSSLVRDELIKISFLFLFLFIHYSCILVDRENISLLYCFPSRVNHHQSLKRDPEFLFFFKSILLSCRGLVTYFRCGHVTLWARGSLISSFRGRYCFVVPLYFLSNSVAPLLVIISNVYPVVFSFRQLFARPRGF